MRHPFTAAATLMSGALFAAAPALAAPQVRIDSGLLRGDVADRIESFKGIPFAAPPVGPLRWRAPQPVAPWQGVRTATAYGHDCMQVPFPSDAAPLGTPPAEDCLYANVWRPAGAAAGGKLPVLVWIYGGGFVNGGSSPPSYSGAPLAGQGLVVVSFNYRVGRFGTFVHPALAKADGAAEPAGNYGYLDEIAALKWVRRNIAAFGGDPAQVTIVGESAGGMSVHMLLGSPLATGLFQRAVIMSGSNGTPVGDASPAAAEKASIAFAQAKGIGVDDPDAAARLRALSADAVTDGLNMAQMASARTTFASPYVDGRIAVDALTAYKAGTFARVPLMIGATSADMGGRTGRMVAGARTIAGLIAARGVPVWEYRFSYVADSLRTPDMAGAKHASDVPYFFDTVAIKYGDRATAKDVGMGRAMATYLANFAKHGDPNGAGLPAWPRYAAGREAIMDFATTGAPAPGPDPLAAELAAAGT